MALEGFTINGRTQEEDQGSSDSSTTALKGFTIGNVTPKPSSSPQIQKAVDSLPAEMPAPKERTKVGSFLHNLFSPKVKEAVDSLPPPDDSFAGIVKNTFSKEGLTQASKKVSDFLINKPIQYLGEKLYEHNKDYFDQVTTGLDIQKQEGTKNLGEEILKKAQYGMGAIEGLTGGNIKPNYTEKPNDFLSKAIYETSKGIGMAVAIEATGSTVFGKLKAPQVLLDSLSKYPKIATYFNQLARNIPAFVTYGQLNVNQTNKERLTHAAFDLAGAPVYTALGFIKDTKMRVPLSGVLGFGVAKLSGASTEDAIASGIAFSLLDLAGTGKGERPIRDIITSRDVRGILHADAIDTINEFSEHKITETSSKDDINKAFKNAALKTHPDTGGNEKDFSRINSARDILLGKTKETPLISEETKPTTETEGPKKEDLTTIAKQVKTKSKLVESKLRYDTNSPTLKAFENSRPIQTVGNFELGTFGKNSVMRKTGQADRFPLSELKITLDNITDSYRASNDPNNYRVDNVAHIAEMPNGEKRVIYTRLNARGKEEIINWHSLSPEKAEAYINTLKSYGTPERNRTSNLLVRTEVPSPLGHGSNKSIPDKGGISQGTRKDLPEVKLDIEHVKKEFKRLGISGIDPQIASIILTPDNEAAFGVRFGEKIAFTDFIQKFTELHEPFHYMWNNFDKIDLFKGLNKDDLLVEARTKYKGKTDAEIEEELAIDLQQYAYDREQGQPTSFTGKLRAFFEKIYQSLKNIFNKRKDLNELFRRMYEGKAKIQTEVNPELSKSQLEWWDQKIAEGKLDFRVQKAAASFLKEMPEDEVFNDSGDLTLKTIQRLEGRTTVSKQFIEDLTNSGDIKQVERDLIRSLLEDEGDRIAVAEFVNKVKDQLLPLEVHQAGVVTGHGTNVDARYEYVTLPADVRGDIANYEEKIYESPVETRAGLIHFGGESKNYFGHTRVEDMAGTPTRRVIEVQSDLYQKGNLQEELDRGPGYRAIEGKKENRDFNEALFKEKSKLAQYNDPTAHFRMVREEIRQAAIDGKTKLQFPTGETALKIEGIGQNSDWIGTDEDESNFNIEPGDLKVGMEISRRGDFGSGSDWVITDVLGDGKFKAVPKINYDLAKGKAAFPFNSDIHKMSPEQYIERLSETFDVSNQVDTSNPIYRFYEKDLGRYLKNNYDAKPVMDDKGVTWYEMDVDPKEANVPVPAFNKKNPPFDSGDKEKDARDVLAYAEKRVGTKPVDITNLENQLDKFKRSLADAESKPEAHAKAYGRDKRPEYKEKITELKQRIQQGKQVNTIISTGKLSQGELMDILKPANIKEEKLRATPSSKIELPEDLQRRQAEISELSTIIEQKKAILEDHPGAKLQKLISRKEGEFLDFKNPDLANTPSEREAIIEKNKRTMKAAEAALEGTQFSDMFDDPDTIRHLIEDYKQQKQQLIDISKERMALKKDFYRDRNIFYGEERDRIAINNLIGREERARVLSEVEKIIRKEGQDRRKRVEAIRDYFYLTQKELSEISGHEDYRLLSDKEFEDFLKKVQNKGYEIAKHAQAIAEVEYTKTQKNLQLTENLQEAMGLSRSLDKLSTEQLDKLNELLGLFEDNDVFLGTREIQTLAKNTDLPEVKTQRQIIRALFPNVPLERLKQIEVKWHEYAQSATALSQNDPLKEYMVLDLRQLLNEEHREFRLEEKKVNELAKKARQSRKRSMLDRLVPTDKLIREYLEEPDPETKTFIATRLTRAELEYAHYLRDGWEAERDYLIKKDVLDRFIENYVTHRRRGFLEAWLKNDTNLTGKFKWIKSFARAIKETFWDAHKLDQASFNILDTKTGTILPLEKFFQYAMRRSGRLIPTNNMATAYLAYRKTFGIKKVLDAYMPKIEAVSRAIAPKQETEGGVIMNDDIVEFVKEFINTQKGRPMAFGKVLRPGNGLDIAIRMGVAFVRMKALAFNFASQITSPIGEQYATFIQLGAKKYATGVIRGRTKQGKLLKKKYEAFVGETLWKKLKNQSKDIGNKFGELAFGGFSIASRRANITHLLGEMTSEEFKSGNIEPKRLAVIKNEMGRWRAEDQLSGIVAKTSLGGMLRQFRSWAIPIAQQAIKNTAKIAGMMKKEGFKKGANSKEAGELFRATVPLILLLWAVHGVYSSLKNKKSRSFSEQMAYKIMQEIGSSLAALAPSTFFSIAPLQKWLSDTATALTNYIYALSTNERSASGEIPGAKGLKQAFTPAITSQFKSIRTTPLQDALTAENTATKVFNDEAEAEWESLKKIAAEDKQKANDAFTQLEAENPKLADRVYEIGQDDKKGLTAEDRQIKSLGVENGNRARYIYGEVSKLKTKEEKNAYITGLDDKGIISDKVYEQLQAMIKEGQPMYEEGQETSDNSLISTIFTYAKAIGVDPITAFNRIFTGQKIRRVDNGTVIVERLPLEKSSKIKSEQGGNNPTMKLDHTIPLELGGSNSKDNLKLVTTEEWDSYTPVENYLGKELRAGKITKKEAQDLITQFKNGELLASDIIK